MNKRYFLIVGGVLAFVALVALYIGVVTPWLHNRTIETVAEMTIKHEESGLSFSYPSGEDAYALIEPPVTSGPDDLQKAYLLMEGDAYRSFFAQQGQTEGPPVISIMVFTSPERTEADAEVGRITRLQNWAIANSQYSSYSVLISEPEVTEIDGATALHYKTDGLYQQEVYVCSYKGHILVFTGQSIAETDPIRTAFADLLATVSLD